MTPGGCGRPTTTNGGCCLSHAVLCGQNAQCVAFFPAPLPLPGYYPASFTDIVACVPPTACPGIDASQVSASLLQQSSLVGSDVANLMQHYLQAPANGSGDTNASEFTLVQFRTQLLSTLTVAHDSCDVGYGGPACASCLSGGFLEEVLSRRWATCWD